MSVALVQVIELLWNLFDLAPDTANQAAAAAAAASSSTLSTQQQQQRLQESSQQDANLEQQHQELQAPQQESLCEQPQQEQQQDHQQEACRQPSNIHHISPVAEQLIAVLAMALQQQVATSNSLQVGGCVCCASALIIFLCLIQSNAHTSLCTCLVYLIF
jgi:hypothetical protein